MMSRVAEQCFWMGRYLERAENTARILEVNRALLLDLDVPLERQWKPLLIISGIQADPGEGAEAVQAYLTWDTSERSSIASSLAAARENARTMREAISAAMWERINYYYLWMQGPARRLYASNRSEFYCQIQRISQLVHGIGLATMSHGEAWEFFHLGKYLERACQTARILGVKYRALPTAGHSGAPLDGAHWVAILTSCAGYEPYQQQRLGRADPGVSVAEFLTFDPLFPRSVRRCLRECQAAAHALSGRPVPQPGNAVEHALRGLIDWLEAEKINGLIRGELHVALAGVVTRLHGIGDAIRRTYFDVGPHRQPALPPTCPPSNSGQAPLKPAGPCRCQSAG
jgi:uncharacterized alpha-E superfamily protein